jgi:hypothetical protein
MWSYRIDFSLSRPLIPSLGKPASEFRQSPLTEATEVGLSAAGALSQLYFQA